MKTKNNSAQPRIQRITISNPKHKGPEVILNSPPTFENKEQSNNKFLKQAAGGAFKHSSIQNFNSDVNKGRRNYNYDYVFNSDFNEGTGMGETHFRDSKSVV
jgi:hypothetical protein